MINGGVKIMTQEERTLRTKTALAESLKKYMKKKPLGKITVSELITDCNVNRKTFYYHFEDIYALLKWMLEQEAFEVVKNFDLLLDYEDAIRFVIEYVKDNAHILNCAYDSIGRDELKRFFYNDFISIIQNVVNDTEKQCGLSVSKDFKTFLCKFLTEAIAGMLVDELKGKPELKQENVSRNITVILTSLPEILRRAPQESSSSAE